MNKKIITSVIIGSILSFGIVALAQTSGGITVPAGGTGLTSVPQNYVLMGNSSLHLTAVATSSLGISGGGGTSNWATTSSNYWLTQNRGNAFSTTSADYWGSNKGYLSGVVSVPNGGTGWANLMAGSVLYGNGTGALATSSKFTFDGNNLSVPVITTAVSTTSTTTFQGPTEVVSQPNGANSNCTFIVTDAASQNYIPVVPHYNCIHIVGNGGFTAFYMDNFAGSGIIRNIMDFRSALGSSSMPLQISGAGQDAVRLAGRFYTDAATTTSIWAGFSASTAAMDITSAGVISSTSQPTSIIFRTTDVNQVGGGSSDVPYERVRIQPSGGMSIGDSGNVTLTGFNSVDPGNGTLAVKNAVAIGTSTPSGMLYLVASSTAAPSSYINIYDPSAGQQYLKVASSSFAYGSFQTDNSPPNAMNMLFGPQSSVTSGTTYGTLIGNANALASGGSNVVIGYNNSQSPGSAGQIGVTLIGNSNLWSSTANSNGGLLAGYALTNGKASGSASGAVVAGWNQNNDHTSFGLYGTGSANGTVLLGSATTGHQMIINNASAGSVGIGQNIYNSGNNTLCIGTNISCMANGAMFIGYNSGASNIVNTTASSLAFGINQIDMLIQQNKIGIGTTTPDSTLDVNGSVRFEGISSVVTNSISGAIVGLGCDSADTASSVTLASTTAFITTPETYPGDGLTWQSYALNSTTFRTKVCSDVTVTPTASLYVVKIIN
jgi:hypothetical protein